MRRVVLRKRLARAIAAGHPWIYRDALAPSPPIADGTAVLVANGDGRPLARGFWDSRSPIAVRVMAGAHGDDIWREVPARLAAALGHRLTIVDRASTDAFRWAHGEADGVPGVHVDVYGDALAVRFDGGGARAFYRDLAAQLAAVAAAAGWPVRTVVERRPRGRRGASRAPAVGGDGDGNDDDEDRDAVPLLGQLPAGEIEIRENGLRFGVDLRRGQKGGLFLDQRDNRATVRALAGGRRVLNLFGYTGGFSIYAAAGGASGTVTVDVAAPAVEAARRNFARNDLDLDRARFVVGDAFEFLSGAAAAGDRYDVIVSDPPSFAPRRSAVDAGLRAYQRLHRLCAAVAAPGAVLCAASCSSHVGRDAFVASVRDGARDAGRRFTLRELRGAGPDHPVLPAFPEGDYLKFAIGVVDPL